MLRPTSIPCACHEARRMRMLEWWSKHRRSRQIARHMAEARRNGKGVRARDWTFNEAGTDQDHVASQVIAWCQAALAECRRPWGVNRFDLAIALRTGESQNSERLTFTHADPKSLYDGSIHESLSTWLAARPARPLYMAGAFFSWGEAAFAAVQSAG